jgi:hypothetical protein
MCDRNDHRPWTIGRHKLAMKKPLKYSMCAAVEAVVALRLCPRLGRMAELEFHRGVTDVTGDFQT